MQVTTCQAADFSLFSAESFVGLVFLMTIGIIFIGALIATTSRRMVRCVAGLALCFTGVAGAYYFLLSPFLAMMQMLIYVGAVAVLIGFAIMMAAPEKGDMPGRQITRFSGPLGFALGGIVFAVFLVLAVKTEWQSFPRTAPADIMEMGRVFLTSHALAFELISLVLFMAIVGALVLARKGRN